MQEMQNQIVIMYFKWHPVKRSTGQKVPKSKGLQVKRPPSQKVYKSKGPQVKRSTSQKAPSQKVYKSKSPQSKGLQKFESLRGI